VQGAYANPKMKGQIEGKWDELHRIVKKMLQDRAPDVPEVTVKHAAGQSEPTTARPDDGGKTARAAALRKRRDSATDALIDGRISEEIYRDVIARIDAELNEL
jgi:hypothetical protein